MFSHHYFHWTCGNPQQVRLLEEEMSVQLPFPKEKDVTGLICGNFVVTFHEWPQKHRDSGRLQSPFPSISESVHWWADGPYQSQHQEIISSALGIVAPSERIALASHRPRPTTCPKSELVAGMHRKLRASLPNHEKLTLCILHQASGSSPPSIVGFIRQLSSSAFIGIRQVHSGGRRRYSLALEEAAQWLLSLPSAAPWGMASMVLTLALFSCTYRDNSCQRFAVWCDFEQLGIVCKQKMPMSVVKMSLVLMWHFVLQNYTKRKDKLPLYHILHFDLHSFFDVWDNLYTYVVSLESRIKERSHVQ